MEQRFWFCLKSVILIKSVFVNTWRNLLTIIREATAEQNQRSKNSMGLEMIERYVKVS